MTNDEYEESLRYARNLIQEADPERVYDFFELADAMKEEVGHLKAKSDDFGDMALAERLSSTADQLERAGESLSKAPAERTMAETLYPDMKGE